MMFWATTFVFIAARGLGKTFASAVYCVTRCILYPGTRVCVVSKTRGQAALVLEKIIQELVPRSEELNAEINWRDTKVNNTLAQIVFHNTSVIKVVTASDTSRGNRSNVLLIDEFRLVSLGTIKSVLTKFLNYRRMPVYDELTDEERKREYDKEKNLTLYLSSAWFKDHWAYTKCLDTFSAMVSGTRKQFVCGFPYQLSIKEGLLDTETVADEMADTDFNEVSWLMEMCAEWYGSDDDSFFDFPSISKNRRIQYPMLPDRISSRLKESGVVKISPKPHGVLRILSVDIALMASTRHKNDTTAIFINQLVPTKAGRCTSNIIYADAYEGIRTDDLALIIRKMFDEYACDYLVIDAAGLGLGVVDTLLRDIVDPETGEVYPAISCCNNPEIASRCTVPNASKVIWAIKASAQFNSECALLLREGFRSGRVRLLTTEYEARDALNELKGYSSLSPAEQMEFQMPYIHTTLLVDELVKLQHDTSGDKVRLKERSGERKDRYSSLSYNYYVALQLENKLGRRGWSDDSSSETFVIKPPTYTGKAVNRTNVNIRQTTWR